MEKTALELFTAPHPADISGKTLRALITYQASTNGLRTAQNIIEAKLRNSRSILTNYKQTQVRHNKTGAEHIFQTQLSLSQMRREVRKAQTIRDLFLIEARAATVYWRAVKLITRQAENWRRIHPAAADPLNFLLNTGYTIIARFCRQAIISAGLLPQLGILHGENTVQPLVYDAAEIFRQPAVDALILPIFSRKQKQALRLPRRDMRRAFNLLHHSFERRFFLRRKV